MKKPSEQVKPCMCECHVYGNAILEFMPCCKHCGKEYINKDGTVDETKWFEICMDDMNHFPSLENAKRKNVQPKYVDIKKLKE